MFFLSPRFSFPLCGCYLGSLPTWSALSPTTTYLIFLRHAQFLTALKQKPQWLPVPYKIKSKLSLAFKIPIINSNQHPSSQTSLQPVLIKSPPPLPFILPLPFLLSRSFYFHAVIFFALRMSFPCLSASPNLAQFLKDLPNSTLSLRFPCPFCNWVPVKVYLTFCGPCLFYLIISLNTLFPVKPELISPPCYCPQHLAHYLVCSKCSMSVEWMKGNISIDFTTNMNKSAMGYCICNNYSTPIW